MDNSELHAQARHCKHWLVARLGHLGDVALTTGVLRWWGERYGLRFHVLTKPAWAPLFAHHPHVERVVPFPEFAHSASGAIPFFHALAKEYTGWGFADLHGVLRTRVLSALWHGPVARYPKMGLQRRLFMAFGVQSMGQALRAMNVPQRYSLTLQNTPPPAQSLLPQVWLTPEESATARATLDTVHAAGMKGLPPAAPIALHPFAAHRWKTWPEHTWRTLATLLRQSGIPFIVLGQGTPLLPNAPEDLVNNTTLRETCALLGHCRCLITGDSGPMHLASAVGTPVVALFGPTTPEWGFYPAGPHDTVLERPLPCRPCSLHGKGTCPRNGQCLQDIAPEEVVACALRLPLQPRQSQE
ncbi:glycosyltransferase family 9 protein [Desulfovibrio cuneatus]|uniref:glycosyltransferase family 9 protein n=1 Tax=Desulfovibrio cuneatus TaxID=159728 RepID=UPI0004277240|nr:glycosyltransferase family 9 protein [Desulfovibrio cuneatus]